MDRAQVTNTSNQDIWRKYDIALRCLGLVVGMVSSIIIGLSKENKYKPISLIPTLPPRILYFSAKWNQYPVFVYFVVINAMACTYAAISLIARIKKRGGRTRRLISDTLVLVLLFAGVVAATFVRLDDKTELHCDVLQSFCIRIVFGIAYSLIACITYLALIVISCIS